MSDRIADFLFDYVIPALLVIVALAVVALSGLAIYAIATEAERPCSDFADTSARNLPARCVAYWEQQR